MIEQLYGCEVKPCQVPTQGVIETGSGGTTEGHCATGPPSPFPALPPTLITESYKLPHPTLS